MHFKLPAESKSNKQIVNFLSNSICGKINLIFSAEGSQKIYQANVLLYNGVLTTNYNRDNKVDSTFVPNLNTECFVLQYISIHQGETNICKVGFLALPIQGVSYDVRVVTKSIPEMRCPPLTLHQNDTTEMSVDIVSGCNSCYMEVRRRNNSLYEQHSHNMAAMFFELVDDLVRTSSILPWYREGGGAKRPITYFTTNLDFQWTYEAMAKNDTGLIAVHHTQNSDAYREKADERHWNPDIKIFGTMQEFTFTYTDTRERTKQVCLKLVTFSSHYINKKTIAYNWTTLVVNGQATITDHRLFSDRTLSINIDQSRCASDDVSTGILHLQINPTVSIQKLAHVRHRMEETPCCDDEVEYVYYVLWRDSNDKWFIYLFIYCHLYSAFSIVQCSNALYRL